MLAEAHVTTDCRLFMSVEVEPILYAPFTERESIRVAFSLFCYYNLFQLVIVV